MILVAYMSTPYISLHTNIGVMESFYQYATEKSSGIAIINANN